MDLVSAHGRLMEPVSRASAWRKGYNVPADYTDNQGFCGGVDVQWKQNGGRCGVCGDPDSDNPGEHEAPGRFATGLIVRRYTSGQIINVEVQITADHKGYFTFRVCPNEDFSLDKGQDCFDRYLLPVGPTFTSTKWYLPSAGVATTHYLQVKLPAGLVCNTQCIFQWTYTTGNSWGICPDGTGALGCGEQETFRACSDIVITGSGSPPPPPPPTSQTTTTPRPVTTSWAPPPPPPSGGNCVAIPPWSYTAGMNEWCNSNCNHVPSYCPSTMCKC